MVQLFPGRNAAHAVTPGSTLAANSGRPYSAWPVRTSRWVGMKVLITVPSATRLRAFRIHTRKQRGGPVAFVVVGHGATAPLLPRQPGQEFPTHRTSSDRQDRSGVGLVRTSVSVPSSVRAASGSPCRWSPAGWIRRRRSGVRAARCSPVRPHPPPGSAWKRRPRGIPPGGRKAWSVSGWASRS